MMSEKERSNGHNVPSIPCASSHTRLQQASIKPKQRLPYVPQSQPPVMMEMTQDCPIEWNEDENSDDDIHRQQHAAAQNSEKKTTRKRQSLLETSSSYFKDKKKQKVNNDDNGDDEIDGFFSMLKRDECENRIQHPPQGKSRGASSKRISLASKFQKRSKILEEDSLSPFGDTNDVNRRKRRRRQRPRQRKHHQKHLDYSCSLRPPETLIDTYVTGSKIKRPINETPRGQRSSHRQMLQTDPIQPSLPKKIENKFPTVRQVTLPLSSGGSDDNNHHPKESDNEFGDFVLDDDAMANLDVLLSMKSSQQPLPPQFNTGQRQRNIPIEPMADTKDMRDNLNCRHQAVVVRNCTNPREKERATSIPPSLNKTSILHDRNATIDNRGSTCNGSYIRPHCHGNSTISAVRQQQQLTKQPEPTLVSYGPQACAVSKIGSLTMIAPSSLTPSEKEIVEANDFVNSRDNDDDFGHFPDGIDFDEIDKAVEIRLTQSTKTSHRKSVPLDTSSSSYEFNPQDRYEPHL